MQHQTRFFGIIVLSALIFITGTSNAFATFIPDGEIISFTGDGGDQNWSNPANWDLDRVPAVCDLVIISGDEPYTVRFDQAFFRLGNEMEIGPDDTFIVEGGKTLDHTPELSCLTLNAMAETIINDGDFQVFGILINNGNFINHGKVTNCGEITGVEAVPDVLPCPEDTVAGELLPTDSTALFLAGLSQGAVWLVPTLAGIAGAGIIIRSRLHK